MGPVTTGNLLLRSFAIFRAGFVPFATLALVFYSPVAILQLIAPAAVVDGTDLASMLGGTSGLVLLFAHVLLIPIASAAVVFAVFQGLRGRPATIGQCISVATSRWPAIIGLAILTVVLAGIGFMLCVVPGVVLTYGLFVAGPALIVEKLGPIEAMHRSWALTDGYKLILFSLAIAIAVVQLAVSIPINLAFGADALSQDPLPTGFGLLQILESVVIVVFTAFNAVAAGVAYHDLRSFREGLDEDQLVAVFD